LQQEKQYELYNDHNEHCDINQKLKYSDIRHEYLTHVIEARTKRELDAAPASMSSGPNKKIFGIAF
jgi:hypothetical protein